MSAVNAPKKMPVSTAKGPKPVSLIDTTSAPAATSTPTSASLTAQGKSAAGSATPWTAGSPAKSGAVAAAPKPAAVTGAAMVDTTKPPVRPSAAQPPVPAAGAVSRPTPVVAEGGNRAANGTVNSPVYGTVNRPVYGTANSPVHGTANSTGSNDAASIAVADADSDAGDDVSDTGDDADAMFDESSFGFLGGIVPTSVFESESLNGKERELLERLSLSHIDEPVEPQVEAMAEDAAHAFGNRFIFKELDDVFVLRRTMTSRHNLDGEVDVIVDFDPSLGDDLKKRQKDLERDLLARIMTDISICVTLQRQVSKGGADLGLIPYCQLVKGCVQINERWGQMQVMNNHICQAGLPEVYRTRSAGESRMVPMSLEDHWSMVTSALPMAETIESRSVVVIYLERRKDLMKMLLPAMKASVESKSDQRVNNNLFRLPAELYKD